MPTEEYFDEEVNDESVGGGGFPILANGRYHFKVTDVSDDDGSESFSIDAEVMAGTKPDQVGLEHREYFPKNSKTGNRKKRIALALACGIVTPEQIQDAKVSGEALSIDWNDCYGCHFCAEIEQDEYNGKVRAKVPYSNIYHVDSKDVKRLKIPVNRKAIEASDQPDPFGQPEGEHPEPTEAAKDQGSFF